jgi:hypothetical protein
MAAGPLEFASYINDVVLTILVFFQKPVHPQGLFEWLKPMASDEESRALLMHEEPLYIAADFLGIDRFSPNFRVTEQAYEQFRARLLYPSRAQSSTSSQQPVP